MNQKKINLFITYLLDSLENFDFFEKYPEISINEIKSFLSLCQKKLNQNNLKKLSIFTDGASKGNPGPAGAGFVIVKNREIIDKGFKFLGVKTNNEAEYLALILALEKINKLNCNELDIYMDSELVVKQIKGDYKVRNKRLLPLYENVMELLKNINFKIFHIPREKNKLADELANKAINSH